MSQRIYLPFDVTIDTCEAIDWADQFPGTVARGIVTSALAFRGCACSAAGRDDQPHHAQCPAAALVTPAYGGARRYAIGPAELAPDGISFRLTLFGPAIRRYDHLLDAFDVLARHGIGPARTPVERIRVQRAGEEVFDSEGSWMRFPGEPDKILPPWEAAEEGRQARRFELATPLDLGWKRRPADPATAASVASLGRAFVRRWIALEDGAEPVAAHEVQEAAAGWLSALDGVEAPLQEAAWQSVTRFSPRQRREMSFHGLVGHFETDAPAAAALSAVIEHVPVGGRTAFGFGSVRCADG